MRARIVGSFLLAVTAVAGVAAAQEVGIIRGAAGCPVGSSEVWFAMDNEDTNEKSAVHGWTGGITLDSNGNIKYRFCRIPGSLIVNAPGKFAVLQLGASCPAGATRIFRHFDNEKRNNQNSSGPSAAALSPNYSNRQWNETGLYFCVFPGGSGHFPNLGVEYGVFARQSGQPNAFAWGEVFSDDEDTQIFQNDNWWVGTNIIGSFGERGRTLPYSDTFYIVDGDQNTSLFTAKVGVTAPPTRPIANCTVSPAYGNYGVQSTFTADGSAARGGRTIVGYSWIFSGSATPVPGPGPHLRTFTNLNVPYVEHRNTLTVTDSAGETSAATCSVGVYGPGGTGG
jgi:hypothetical protein